MDTSQAEEAVCEKGFRVDVQSGGLRRAVSDVVSVRMGICEYRHLLPYDL